MQIISASRRTDLPRCYPEVLSGWLQNGWVEVQNPFNGQKKTVDLRPENVHTLVLWSKDYRRLLANEERLRDRVREYAQLYVHFTLTGLGHTRLEPGVEPWEITVRQLDALVELTGSPQRVNWRFDPIVFWKEAGQVQSNLQRFDRMARAASQSGLERVTVSLCQWYAKSQRRAERYGLDYLEPRALRMEPLAKWIGEHAARFRLTVQACCSPELVRCGVTPARCIDGLRLTELHPQKLAAVPGKDPGQRNDCGCTLSVDIGSYRMACPQGCVYCYANPVAAGLGRAENPAEPRGE